VFYGNGEVNPQNTRYWSQHNPHRWYTDSKEQAATRLMVRCGMWNTEHLCQRMIEACNAITPGIIKRVSWLGKTAYWASSVNKSFCFAFFFVLWCWTHGTACRNAPSDWLVLAPFVACYPYQVLPPIERQKASLTRMSRTGWGTSLIKHASYNKLWWVLLEVHEKDDWVKRHVEKPTARQPFG
jgi:hypothetical protein